MNDPKKPDIQQANKVLYIRRDTSRVPIPLLPHHAATAYLWYTLSINGINPVTLSLWFFRKNDFIHKITFCVF